MSTITEMLETILSGNLTESTNTFKSLLNEKIKRKLATKKMEVAKTMCSENKDSDEDEDDSEFSKHPMNQLQKIASYQKLSPEEKVEYTATGEVDKRSLRNTRSDGDVAPTFKHVNGEVSSIHPDEAQELVKVLQSTSIKPSTKEKVFATLHSSKEGFDKIRNALKGSTASEKSVYGADSRT